MRSRLSTLALLLLCSCASPPHPPTVEALPRRPANTAQALELQVCKGDLRDAQLAASESTRQAAANAATVERLLVHQRIVAAAKPVAAQGNAIYTVNFGLGSARSVIPADTLSALVEDARASPLVVLRGRTDAQSDSAAESRLARERALAVKERLVAAGVDRTRVRVTYQASGDHVADNTTAAGREANRRVEIEVYRAHPSSPAPATPSSTSE